MIIAVVQLLIMGLVRCDLPVSCKKGGGDVNYIGSTWTFHINQDQQEVNLYEQNEVCTHTMPNKVQIIADSFAFQFAA